LRSDTVPPPSPHSCLCTSQSLSKPLPSAELQLDTKEKLQKATAATGGGANDLAKSNPLLLFLKEKSDLKFAERKEQRMKGGKSKLDKKKGKKEREREKEKEPPKILMKVVNHNPCCSAPVLL
jgi:hypothetical protein